MDGSVVGVADVGETDMHRLDEVGGSNGPSRLGERERERERGKEREKEREGERRREREMDGERGGW